MSRSPRAAILPGADAGHIKLVAPPARAEVVRLPPAMPFPRVDEHLVEPEVTRDELVRGRRVVALPAHPPHADRHGDLHYVVRAHTRKSYIAAIDLLTRLDERSNFATDTSVRRSGVDQATGSRYLEEVAFEVVHEQSLRDITERGEDLCARGVRRFFAIFVKKGEVHEYSGGRWTRLDGEAYIEDPCFVRPLLVRALLEAAAADRAVVQALDAKNDPTIAEIRANERANDILAVLEARAIPVPEPVRAHILGTTDRAILAQWLTRAATANSLAEILDPGLL